MDEDRRLAQLALSLVLGALRGNDAAESLAVDTFDDLDQAARAHAYLAGFLLELLATERRARPEVTAIQVRSVIDRR